MKFVKHSNCIYVLFAILAIFSIAVCMAVAVGNGFDPLSDYTTFFYASSLGAFSAQYNKCQYSLINTTLNTVSFDVSCPNGLINSSVTTNVIPAVISN